MLGWYRQQSPTMMALASIIGWEIRRRRIPAPRRSVQRCWNSGAALAMARWHRRRATRTGGSPRRLQSLPYRQRARMGGRGGPDQRHLHRGRSFHAGRTPGTPDAATDGLRDDARSVELDPARRPKRHRALAGSEGPPGGLVHVSYNALPGWQDRSVPRAIIREAGQRLAGRSDRQVREGLEVVKRSDRGRTHPIAARVSGLVKTLGDRVAALPRARIHEPTLGAVLHHGRRRGVSARPSWNGSRPATWRRIFRN